MTEPAGPAAPDGRLPELVRRFLTGRRVAHLATADREGVPHLVPVCFAVAESTIYITLDEKPKAGHGPLKRLRNIAENPAVAFLADRYDEDWSLLGWVMIRGNARILASGTEHDDGQARLRRRYPQLEAMQISALPVIAIAIERVTSWGNLRELRRDAGE